MRLYYRDYLLEQSYRKRGNYPISQPHYGLQGGLDYPKNGFSASNTQFASDS